MKCCWKLSLNILTCWKNIFLVCSMLQTRLITWLVKLVFASELLWNLEGGAWFAVVGVVSKLKLDFWSSGRWFEAGLCIMTVVSLDYMRPVQTQTITTSDRSPCYFMLVSVYIKPVFKVIWDWFHWTDEMTQTNLRSEQGAMFTVYTNRVQTRLRFLFWKWKPRTM